MDFCEHLDAFLEEAVVELYTAGQAAYLLLSEDFRFNSHEGEVLILAEARRYGPKMQKRKKLAQRGQKRVFRKVAGGGRVLIKKTGRVNIGRSINMRRSKQKRIMAQKRAQRNPQTKMKRRRTMQARSRLMPRRKSYKGAHGTKRHGPPRPRRRR